MTSPQRSAMTLIELLIVVTISALLLGITVPLMKPALDDSRIREASRQVNTQFLIAEARAAEIGRTVAVWIERTPGATTPTGQNIAQQLYLAESPPPYTGDFLNSRAIANPAGNTPYLIHFDSPAYTNPITGAPFNAAASATLPALVKTGDAIKFDYKGANYIITSVSPLGNVPAWVTLSSAPPADFAGRPMPYQISRQPVKSMLPPLQLAGNVCIDLDYSGMELYRDSIMASQQVFRLGTTVHYLGREFAARTSAPSIGSQPVLIGFSPRGGLDFVSVGGVARPATGTVHLLLGQSDKVGEVWAESTNPLPYSAGDNTSVTYGTNLVDPSNLWVSIGHRNGSVTSSENAWELSSYFLNSFLLAREFAITAQSKGGR
ncbi:MAG: Tfp pilus assembly protein FimT/FimU [Pirellulales bacterium]